MREVCDEIGPDDGVDPRQLARERMKQHRSVRPGPPGPKAPGRKALQLGHQVAQALDAVLAGDSRDEALRGLRVVSVAPAAGASCFLVTVAPDPPFDPREVLARLEHASGWLRTEVAAAVTRKRAPVLSFQIGLLDDPAV